MLDRTANYSQARLIVKHVKAMSNYVGYWFWLNLLPHLTLTLDLHPFGSRIRPTIKHPKCPHNWFLELRLIYLLPRDKHMLSCYKATYYAYTLKSEVLSVICACKLYSTSLGLGYACSQPMLLFWSFAIHLNPLSPPPSRISNKKFWIKRAFSNIEPVVTLLKRVVGHYPHFQKPVLYVCYSLRFAFLLANHKLVKSDLL